MATVGGAFRVARWCLSTKDERKLKEVTKANRELVAKHVKSSKTSTKPERGAAAPAPQVLVWHWNCPLCRASQNGFRSVEDASFGFNLHWQQRHYLPAQPMSGGA
jgi:hypothetical protein